MAVKTALISNDVKSSACKGTRCVDRITMMLRTILTNLGFTWCKKDILPLLEESGLFAQANEKNRSA